MKPIVIENEAAATKPLVKTPTTAVQKKLEALIICDRKAQGIIK